MSKKMEVLNLCECYKREVKQYRIEYWYDFHQKYWVIQVFTDFDSQEECEVGLKKQELAGEIEYFKKKYNTTKVLKI